MDDARCARLAAWITEAGLAGQSETTLLGPFCEKAVAAGLQLRRATVIVDTLHPIHEGRVFRWAPGNETTLTEYGRTSEGGAAAESWRRSPYYHLVQSGEKLLRRRVTEEAAVEF